MSGTEELLRFHFRVLPLYTRNAQKYVQNHAMAMYPLLATMQGADDTLLLQAIDELIDYYKYSESKLARRLLWLATFMQRADTVLPKHKHKVVVNTVIDRFPALVELAQQRIKQIERPEAFYLLISQLNTAPDESTARFFLTPPLA